MFIAGSTLSGNTANGFVALSPGVINTFGNNNITDPSNTGTLTRVNQQ
jgi:hypothetical protein